MRKKHDVPNRCDDETEDTKPVAMAEAIGQPCRDDRSDSCYHEDRNRPYLGGGGGVAEFFDDCWGEERPSIASIHDSLHVGVYGQHVSEKEDGEDEG